MGTDIECFIEYVRGDAEGPASAGAYVLDFQDYVDLTLAKDYLFIGAVSGVRAPSGQAPLFSRRGLPEDLSPRATELAADLCEPGDKVGWLRLDEIERSLDHMSIDRARLALSTRVTLSVLSFLVERLGNESVRLVFVVS